MAYDVNTLTVKGIELLAAATAADKLVLDGCDATTTFVDAATAALVENRPSSAMSNTTTVSIIGATTEHVMARASFLAGTNTGGDANTLYLYGHKQSAPSDIYVVYVASSQEPFHLPETGDVANVYETLFDMVYAINQNAVTTPGTSTYCTLAEFNLLKGRTVTSHKESDLTSGDNQVIYGQKEFMDYTLFRDDVSVGTLSAGTTTFGGHIRAILDEEDPGVPQFDIGQSSNRFRNLYVSSVVTGAISNGGNQITVSDNVETKSIIPHADAIIHPTLPSGDDIGSSTRHFKAVYANEINGGGTVKVTPSLGCDYIVPIGNATDKVIGSATNPFTHINGGGLRINDDKIGKYHISGSSVVWDSYTKYLAQSNISYADTVVPDSTGGSDDATFSVYFDSSDGYGGFAFTLGNDVKVSCGYTGTKVVTTFNTPVRFNSGDLGFAPGYNTSTSSRTVSIGSILMVYVSDQITLDNNITGRTHHSQNLNKLQFCRSNNGVIEQVAGAPTVPDGTYIWLCDVNNSSSTYALVQCLSLD